MMISGDADSSKISNSDTLFLADWKFIMRVLSPCLAFDCGFLRTRLGDDVAVGLPIELIVELKESGYSDEKRLATLLLRSYGRVEWFGQLQFVQYHDTDVFARLSYAEFGTPIHAVWNHWSQSSQAKAFWFHLHALLHTPQGYFIGPGLVSIPLIIRNNVLIKFSDWLLLWMSLSQYKTQVLLSCSCMASNDSG